MHPSSNDGKDTVRAHGSALGTGGTSLVVTASLIHERLLGLDTSIVTTFDQDGVSKHVRTDRPGVVPTFGGLHCRAVMLQPCVYVRDVFFSMMCTD